MQLSNLLPSSLLAFLAISTPGHSILQPLQTRRNELVEQEAEAEAYNHLPIPQPKCLRKMPSNDPGQMFFPSDWYLLDDDPFPHLNASILDLPILPHISSSSPFARILPFLAKRDFSCPTNTNSCSSIGADYGCCPSGTRCQLDSRGALGCCPGSSGTCTGNTPTNCPQGYTSCPLYRGGGGCCAQGFECQSQGCVGVSTTVVLVYPTITVSSTVTSTVPISISPTTTITVPTSTSTTTLSPITSSTSTSISTSTSTSIPPETGTTPIIPIAPTSLSTVTSTSSQPTTIYLGPCPTGFYGCSAAAVQGACCQVGRDCGRTDCPALVTSTALVSNGITIAGISASGICATGWTTCAGDVGGGCCPSGYGCGRQFCSATATGVESAQASLGSAVAKQGGSTGVGCREREVHLLAAMMFTVLVAVTLA